MTTRIGAAVAAGFLSLGILVGAAGTIVVRDATATDVAHTGDMSASAGSMGNMASMGSMAGMMSMMGGSSEMSPNASMAPGEHESHHAMPSPEATR